MSAFPSPTVYQSGDLRALINRANSQHSTGPARRRQGPRLPKRPHPRPHQPLPRPPFEAPAAYQQHCDAFVAEHQPATHTEQQLVQELADTSWRLNRIPSLEAGLLDRANNPPSEEAAIRFDIVDAHRALASLGLHGQRLSRQFQRTLDHLRQLQAERRAHHERDLSLATALLQLDKNKGISYNPTQDGFVFSVDEIEAFHHRLIRINEAQHISAGA